MQGIIGTKFLLHQTRDNIISAFSYSQLYFILANSTMNDMQNSKASHSHTDPQKALKTC